MHRHINRSSTRGAGSWILACCLAWQSACLAQSDDDYLRSIEAEAANMAAPPASGAAQPEPPPATVTTRPAVAPSTPIVADPSNRLRRDDARVRDFELDLLESSPYTYALYVQLGTDAKLGIANGYLSTGGSPEERLREAAERIQALSR